MAGTPGVSNTTLTGRQWGFAPRIGVAWSPKKFNDKIVVRAGWGMYYDRGELFTYLSPGFTQNIDTGGAFGVNEQQPFVEHSDVRSYRRVRGQWRLLHASESLGQRSRLRRGAAFRKSSQIALPNASCPERPMVPRRPFIWPSTLGTTSFPIR